MVAEVRAWVVDASVAFAWFAAVPNTEQASRLLEAGPGTLLLAPDLVLVELLNPAWKCPASMWPWRAGLPLVMDLANY